MTEGTVRPATLRRFHLQGGCRVADIQNGRIQLMPSLSDGRTAVYGPMSYTAVYKLLDGLGFKIIGVDFYSDVEEIQGAAPPDWRAFHPTKTTGWVCAEQADQWSFIAHAALVGGNGLLWDVASRISHQLRACGWRLRQLSESYREQLYATVRTGRFEDGRRFKDRFTWLGYLAIQSFLVDACVLRDYFAEYRALLLTQAGEFTFPVKVTSMSTLKKKYLDKASLKLPVDKSLSSATSPASTNRPAGWLFELGSYRNLVVHVAPLDNAGHKLFALCESVSLVENTSVPSIKLPIPSDPELLTRRRQVGEYLDDPEQSYARFVSMISETASARDGLCYTHSILERLGTLAVALLAISPYKPDIPAITDKDIISIAQRGGEEAKPSQNTE